MRQTGARRAAAAVRGDTEGVTELVTDDEVLAEAVLASAAALGVPVRREPVAGVRGTGLVLLGADLAGTAVGAQWVERAAVCVVGWGADDVARWSVPLRAQVAVLPGQAAALSTILGAGRARERARLVAVVGAVGGAGTSTLAASLAEASAAAGARTALVDLDERGGGIDLVLGAEQVPGWRWPTLAHATGEVGDLAAGSGSGLPHCRGVDVLSMARAEPGVEPSPGPSAAAVATVLRSLGASHDHVWLDCGRGDGPGLVAAGLASRVLLLVPARVGAVAGARVVAARLRSGGAGVVVRTVPRGLAAGEVASALELPLVGVVPTDHGLAEVVEQGRGPGGGRRWRRAVEQLVAQHG